MKITIFAAIFAAIFVPIIAAVVYLLLRGGPPKGLALVPSGKEGIVVSGREFGFNPAAITVKAGEKTKITFKNDGVSSHNLMIEGLEVGTEIIAGGQQAILEFTPALGGTYKFYCSIPGHREAGMEGIIKVE